VDSLLLAPLRGERPELKPQVCTSHQEKKRNTQKAKFLSQISTRNVSGSAKDFGTRVFGILPATEKKKQNKRSSL